MGQEENQFKLLQSVIRRLYLIENMTPEEMANLKKDAESVLDDPPVNYPLVNGDLALLKKFKKTLGIE